MTRQYYVIFEHGKGSIGAYSPDFPGCISVGNNLEEAKENITDAIEFYLEDCSDIPVTSNLKAIEDVIFEGYKNDNVKVIMQVDIVIPVKKSRRVNITMPEDVLDNIEIYLKKHKEKENRSGLLAEAATEYMAIHA